MILDQNISTAQASSDSLQVLPAREQVVKTIADGVTEYGTHRYRTYLGQELIGKIFVRGTHHYAGLKTIYFGIGKAFDRLEKAEEWLVDAYYSLLEEPIYQKQREGITYIYRGDRAVGEFYYSQTYQVWMAYTQPQAIQSYSERFKTDTDAFTWIINKSLASPTRPRKKPFLVRLQGENECTIATISADPNDLCLPNILDYYNKCNCTEFTSIELIDFN